MEEIQAIEEEDSDEQFEEDDDIWSLQKLKSYW